MEALNFLYTSCDGILLLQLVFLCKNDYDSLVKTGSYMDVILNEIQCFSEGV